MMVDDEPYNLLGLSVILEQSGINNILEIVDKAFNGKEALDLVKKAYK